MAKLEFKVVGKIYPPNVMAVQNFNLEIEDKEFVVFVGPSGCGKSTVLRMVAGLEDITQGEIYIGEGLINHVEPKDRNISMVFQNYALYPHLTAYKNISFGLEVRKMKKAEIEAKVLAAAKMLDIEHLLGRKPGQLSGGEKQRVAIGRAIVRNPDVFLFDEPLSNLDAKLRANMRKELIKLHKDIDATFIYVTHDQIEAMTMADKIVIMNGGVIQQVGTPEEVYNSPANTFVADFIGTPSINFISGIIEKKDGYILKIGDNEIALNDSSMQESRLEIHRGKEVTIGIRPENLSIAGSDNDSAQILKNFKVSQIENTGSDKYIYGMLGNTALTVRGDGNTYASAGDVTNLSVVVENICLFDPETGRNIEL